MLFVIFFCDRFTGSQSQMKWMLGSLLHYATMVIQFFTLRPTQGRSVHGTRSTIDVSWLGMQTKGRLVCDVTIRPSTCSVAVLLILLDLFSRNCAMSRLSLDEWQQHKENPAVGSCCSAGNEMWRNRSKVILLNWTFICVDILIYT